MAIPGVERQSCEINTAALAGSNDPQKQNQELSQPGSNQNLYEMAARHVRYRAMCEAIALADPEDAFELMAHCLATVERPLRAEPENWRQSQKRALRDLFLAMPERTRTSFIKWARGATT